MNLNLATPPDDMSERFLARVYRISLILTLVGVLAINWAGAPMFAVNFVIGAGISVLLVRSTQALVQRHLIPAERPREQRRRFLLLMFAKVPVLIVLFFLLTDGAWFHPLGLILGLSMMPLCITVYGGMKFLMGEI